MKVFDQNNKEIVNLPLNIDSLQLDKIITDEIESVFIPYVNPEFLKAVGSLVYDVVWTNEPVWMCPDYDNSRMSLFITETAEGLNVNLSIEAIPCQYEEEEKQIILSEAKSGTGVACLYDYDTWVSIIASSEAWHSKENNYGENWVYKMELTEEEMKMLKPIVNNYLGMVA